MTTLFKNSLYTFSLINEVKPILFFEWTDQTATMRYEDFQEACNNFAGFAWQYQALHLLVDTCNFHFQLPESFTTWRESELNPRYYKLGVQKFAYITTPEFIQYMKDIATEKGKFGTRNFTSIKEALHWLNQ